MRKREIKTMVESTADPAFAVNGLHLIEFWNKAAEDFFGVSRREATGKTCGAVIGGYDECGKFCNQDCPIFDAAAKHKTIRSFDLQVQTNRGMKWCNISILLAEEDNAVTPHTVHIVRPIDVSKRLEVLVRDFVVKETGISAEEAQALATSSKTPARETSLSDRELQTLRLLAQGKTTNVIAEELFISKTTVNNHVQHILKKLNAHSRLEAVRRAERAGLI